MGKLALILAALTAATMLSGCAAALIGAGAAVVIDEVVEDRQGGDGLF